MPTVLRLGPYRFFFWSEENNEPPHIHIASGDDYAKFWLDQIGLARNEGYTPKELGQIQKLPAQHREQLLESWRDYFRGR